MKHHNIVLVGFMGTGKTAVGNLLAKRLGWRLVDTDHLIEIKEGQSIPELFSSRGEDYFRSTESKVIREVMEQSNQVVATGGGAVLALENRESMLINGFVVALTAQAETIIERVKLDLNRPLLQGNVDERVRLLLEQRKHAYDFAHLSIDTTGITKEAVVDIIMKSELMPNRPS